MGGGFACPAGSEVITSERECSVAASMRHGEFEKAGSWDGSPLGCIFYDNGKYYYNNNVGSQENGATMVCKLKAIEVSRLYMDMRFPSADSITSTSLDQL